MISRLKFATDTHLSQKSIKKKNKNFKLSIQWVKDVLQKFSRDDSSAPFFIYRNSSPCFPPACRLCKAPGYVTGVGNQVPAAQLLVPYSIITEVRYSIQADGGSN